MRIYLAGPMTGLPRYNFDAFMAAAADLQQQGHSVFNPAQHDLNEGFDPSKDKAKNLIDYMAHDIPEVIDSDAVVVLPGWEKSKGARLEAHVAKELGIPVLAFPSLKPVEPTETVCQEADRIVSGGRNEAYGHPRDDFKCIAEMWTAYLSKRHLNADVYVDARDVAMMMVMLKIARDAHQTSRDNLVDGCGYLRCAERLDEPL